jgi:hypothetical protein
MDLQLANVLVKQKPQLKSYPALQQKHPQVQQFNGKT